MSGNPARVLAVSWTLLVILACSIPGADLPEVPLSLTDKVAHLAMFFGLSWFWLSALEGSTLVKGTAVLVAGTAFAILTELYQGLLPFERTPDVLDALANIVGLVLGTASWLIRNRSSQR